MSTAPHRDFHVGNNWGAPDLDRVGLAEPPLTTPTHGYGTEAQFIQKMSEDLQRRYQQPLRKPEPIHRPTWLNTVYSLVAHKQIDDAIDVLFEKFDDLMCEGNFKECDSAIRVTDLSRLDTNLLVALLSITLAAKEHLNERAQLVNKVERRLLELAPDRIEGLMSGLR